MVGREFWSPYGVAEDTSATPPILYVSDINNSRVLAWKNATAFNNGQQADLVIGQKDFYSTFGQGPGQTFPGGLSFPSALAVDTKGNLYVMDAGNNRVLRYPKPFSQQAGSVFPDLYIGQPNLNSSTPNYTGLVAARGLALNAGLGGMAFDGSGNLWITDVGNSRVLEFKASDLAAGGGPLTAILEIGQLDFASNTRLTNTATTSANTRNQLAIPINLAFDSNGWLYIDDFDNSGNITGINRVLVFQPPFSSGQTAFRILGVYYPGATPTPAQRAQSQFIEPNGLFFLPGNAGVGVVDSFLNRIMIFPPAANWPDVTLGTGVSPPAATSVIGQQALSINDVYPNQAAVAGVFPGATGSSLYGPAQVYFSGTELFVADSANNRVVNMLPLNGTTFGAANRVLGQDNMTANAPNLIEGKEFRFTTITSSNQLAADAGMVIDASSGTPHLYVADTYNNRILGFKDARKVTAGAAADIVLGEPDFATSLCNYPTGDPNAPTQSSLCFPSGMAVDTSGNLYVADRGNGRVLRFPAPFAFQGQLEQADLVLGHTNFTTASSPGPAASTMSAPYGLAFSPSCGPAATTCTVNGLLVSDISYNRVLFIPTTNGTFNAGLDNGKPATKVYGQPDFNTVTAGNSNASFSNPRGIAADANGRLYVADTGNNRALIFSDPNNPQTPAAGAQATLPINGLNGPRGVFVNATTGEIWVANTSGAQAVDYPQYDQLQFNLGSTTTIAAPNPIALTQDQYGNLVMADASNRVSLYFPALQAVNGASLVSNLPLAPGMFASICSPGTACANSQKEFGSITASSGDLPNPIPLPLTLGDVQVTLNGSAVPLYYVSPNQLNFVVPMNAPTSNFADLEVVQASTGRLYASAQVPMNVASPGILLQQYTGAVRAAVVANQDFSLNTPTNPAKRGSVITIYATGQGFVPGAPPDGNLPQGLVTTPANPRIIMNGLFLDEIVPGTGDPANGQFVLFSGLSPSFPGIWQINVQIPMTIPPGAQVIIAIIQQGIASATTASGGYVTTFSVSQ